MKISVVIPVYNEAPGLAETLARFEQTLTHLSHVEEFNAWVVDDGSTDDAFQHVTLPSWVTLLRHSVNKGYGASLKTGIRAATHPIIVICDADGSYDIESLSELLRLYQEAELIVAARQSIAYPKLGFLKRTARNFFTFWLWSVTGFWIRDINSGLRVFSRNQIMPILDLLSDRFSFTTGTTLQWILAKRPIHYFSTPYAARRGESKVHFIRDGFGVIRQVLAMLMARRPTRTVFILIMEFLVLAAGVSVLVYSAYGLLHGK